MGEDFEVTYAELDKRSSQLARKLIELEIGPGAFVAVSAGRSVDSVVAGWAVLKAGAAIGHEGATVGIATNGADRAQELEWIVLDDSATKSELAGLSGRPVTQANRVRALTGADPVAAGMTYDELAGVVSRVDADYESRTFAVGARAAVIELVVAGTSGATVALAEAEDDLVDALANEWVTHLFAEPDIIASVDPEDVPDVETVVAIGGAAEFGDRTVVEVL